MTPELVIETADGTRRTVPLEDDRYVLGRSTEASLSYADDTALSRQHLAIARRGDGGWSVEDLGSKNGSFLNGRAIHAPQSLQPGDRVTAGHLTLYLAGESAKATAVWFELESDSTTVATRLDTALRAGTPENTAHSSQHLTALIKAGRELARHRPMDQLLDLILGLATEAVAARRSVLLTGDGTQLVPRASRGQGFHISSTVRDRVMGNRESLLVGDAQTDAALRGQQSIVAQQVRSMLAVPLQTDERVLGLIYADTPEGRLRFSSADLNLLTVLANIAAIRIEHARLAEVEEAERALQRELAQAAQIQQRMLPESPPAVRDFDIAGSSVPCRGVGGDYFDYLPFPSGRVVLLVGDVAGKGMSAALLMSSVQARVQAIFDDEAGLDTMLAHLNRAVCTNCPPGRFITFFAARLDPATGEIDYGNAGHNPPLLVRTSGAVEKLDTGGVVLGVMPGGRYEEKRTAVAPGELLVLYSDGVTEAANARDEEFGEDRLAELVSGWRANSAAEIVARVHEAVAAFSEGAPAADDITVVVVKRRGLIGI